MGCYIFIIFREIPVSYNMRKSFNLIVIALLGMCVSAAAQTNPKPKFIIAKGSKAFTGRVHFVYSKSSPLSSSLGVGIGEQEGFFVANNFSIGTSVGYDFTRFFSAAGEVSNTETRHTPFIGLNFRYYKMFTEKFGFFVQATPSGGYIYTRNVQRSDVGDPLVFQNHGGYFDISVTPNLVFFVTRKFALEANFGRLGYRQMFAKGSGFSGKDAQFSVSPSLNIGMTFYLGKGVQVKG